MKKFTLLFCITLSMILSFSACGNSSSSDTDESQAVKVDSVKYSIETQNFSQELTRDGYTLKEKQYFDLVTVEGEGDAAKEINAGLESRLDDYKESLEETQGYLNDSVGEMFDGDEFINTFDAEVTQNSDGLFSVRYQSEWYQGGVSNANEYGDVFSISSGHKLNLAGALDVSEEEAMSYVVRTVKKAMEEDVDFFSPDALSVVSKIDVDDIEFYLKNGEIYLCFETYLLGPGSNGCSVLKLIENAEEPENNDASKSAETEQKSSGSGGVEYAKYIGKTVSDVSKALGSNYEADYLNGGFAMCYDSSGLYFFMDDSEDYGTMIDDCVIVEEYLYSGKALGKLFANMTFPEIKNAVGDSVSLNEPEYFYNEEDQCYEYYLSFDYSGYTFAYWWYDDPDMVKSDFVDVR